MLNITIVRKSNILLHNEDITNYLFVYFVIYCNTDKYSPVFKLTVTVSEAALEIYSPANS